MNPAIINLGVTLLMMQVAKKVPFEDERVLWGVRGLYLLSNFLILSLYLYTLKLIKKRNDYTTIKYIEPPSPLSGKTEEKFVTTTIKEYDTSQVNAAIKGMFTGVAMMAFMHLYMKYTNPLLIQSIMPLKSALEQKIVKIHVLGKPAEGELKRPFKANDLFSGTPMQGSIKTDKRAVEQAERAGHGGKSNKED